MKLKSEQGYALPSVLLISLLVTTILLALLSIIFFTTKGTSKILEKKRLELACLSAVQLTLSDSVFMYADSLIIEIDSIQVFLVKQEYGFYKQIISTAKGINDSIKIRYTLGSKPEEGHYFKNAVVLTRPNLRATVAGNTDIKGNILATTDRIVLGNLFGETQATTDYIKGTIVVDTKIKSQLISDSTFSRIERSFYECSQTYLIEENIELTETIPENFTIGSVNNIIADLKISGKIKSGDSEGLKIHTSGKIDFAEGTICKKNIELLSDSMITIYRNSHVENALLYCDGPIIIKGGSYFKNVQIFSTDSIYIEDSQFSYPSVICLSIDDSENDKRDNSIVIENSTINGVVLLMTKTAGLSSNRTKIRINKDSKVQGLVYSENNLELIGEVIGTVFTYNFWFYKEPSEYINWLINTKVNREELDKWFLLPAAFSNSGDYKIIKEEWIY